MERLTRPRILPLSDEVISKIHSSRHITSLHDAVIALIQNSLDAGSGRVEVTVDWSRGGCVVEDNGLGIAYSEFRSDGNLGRIYCTSKRQSSTTGATHGSNGTFLAELASLSMLDITSREHGSGITAVLVLHHGSVIDRQFRETQTDDAAFVTPGSQHGTCVTVRDLFGNMPVRVKQRASVKADEQAAWYDLKYQILALLLAWREPCSIKIRDASSGSRMASLVAHSPTTATELTKKNLRQLSGTAQPFDIRDRLSLLFQAGFAAVETRKQWVPVSASTPAISLQGLLCLEPAPTRQCQFISIGIHPCSRKTGHSELYEAVNRIFDHSDFGRAEHGGLEPHRKSLGVARTPGQQSRKNVDRFAMFCIQLTITNDTLYKSSTAGNTSDALIAAIIDVLEASIWSWLEQNLFRPTRQRRLQSRVHEPSMRSAQLLGARTADQSALLSGLNRSRMGGDTNLGSEGTSPENEGPVDVVNDHGSDLNTFSSIRMAGTSKTSSSLPLVIGRRRDNPDIEYQFEDASHDDFNGNDVKGRNLANVNQTRSAFEAAGPVQERFPYGTDLRGNVSGLPPAGVFTAHPYHEPASDSKANEVPDHQNLSDEYGSVDEESMIAATEATESKYFQNEQSPWQNDSTQWTDPISRQVFKLDSRTGNISQIEQHVFALDGGRHEGPSRKSTPIGNTLSRSNKPLRLVDRRVSRNTHSERDQEEARERWLPGFLKTWENPTFNLQIEESIASTSFGNFSFLQPPTSTGTEFGVEQEHVSSLSTIQKSSTQLSKTAFRAAKVVNQVDEKFILCKMAAIATGCGNEIPGGAASRMHEEMIIIVDQHAASERVIVEQLFREFCDDIAIAASDEAAVSHQPTRTAQTELSHMQFVISEKEHELLLTYRNHFDTWGIRYRLLELAMSRADNNSKRASQELRVVIETLPSVIAERCTNFPKLCIDMIRTEIWALADGSKKSFSRAHLRACLTDSNEHISGEHSALWVGCISACPQGIIDMINSRACRSAIMFNDVLSISECHDLVRDLGACAFPFICAHGRASVVPLMSLNNRVASPPPNSNLES